MQPSSLTVASRAAIVALAMAIGLVALACVGDDDDGDAGTAGLVSCPALEELDSYRYDVSVEAAEPETPEPTATGSPAPLAAFGDALAHLFSNFSINGAYVQPDRSQAVLSFQEDELELRAIGQDAWVRSGDEWQTDEAGTDGLLTPVAICGEVLAEVQTYLRPAGSEEVNGVPAERYELDPEKTQDLPSLLGQEVAGGYTVDLWVAENGRWPAKLAIESTDAENDAHFRLAMDVRDVNDEGIEIEPPE